MDNNNQITDRAQKLLKLLVECYIREGQPVGSKTLAEKADFAMSPASIRNIMSDLEMAGFINSPHTSAGRIPTVRGYRFFVDSLLNAHDFVELDAKNMAQQLNQCTNTKELISVASSLLSGVTRLASLVMLPRHDVSVLKHIEFLPLSENRILVILVLSKYEVQNRIIYADRNYTQSELQEIGNFLTANFAGKELQEIRACLVDAIAADFEHIDIINQALSEKQNRDYIISGEANLLGSINSADINRLQQLFEAFQQKNIILHLLDQCLQTDGLKIYIGEESGYEPLDDCSMIAAPYRENGKVIGVLGVIGPTRMPYHQAIAAVDITAKLLSSALEEIV
ncbi:MAG: heat-inducible transcriptional repressor HrcA [Gammaproteobacteria bacterium]|nr:heat-inducible transcriptional repressor HrcA [Gammaproteobacteria bacterium]